MRRDNLEHVWNPEYEWCTSQQFYVRDDLRLSAPMACLDRTTVNIGLSGFHLTDRYDRLGSSVPIRTNLFCLCGRGNITTWNNPRWLVGN